MQKSIDDPKCKNLIIPKEFDLCTMCGSHRMKSEFCSKGFLQHQSFCRRSNSYKIKFFIRRCDRKEKKMKEVYLVSKCMNYTEMVKLYSIFYDSLLY